MPKAATTPRRASRKLWSPATWRGARLAAHTLKGGAAQIGAAAVSALAAALEQSLREGAAPERLQAQQADLAVALTALDDAVRAALPPADEAS
ncbi:MAG: Hpt domain-containing protein [Rubrivivax sp.]